MSMITARREKQKPFTALLFSGGLDSVCFDYLGKPSFLIYVQNRSRYAEAEEHAIYKLRAEKALQGELIPLADKLDLSAYERDDLIVPNRNAHLVLLASNYADTIWLASVKGDRSNDKDEHFYGCMTELLNHMWDDQHWTERRTFKVGSPYKQFTKRRLVAMYLAAKGPPQHLLTSYSCYEGKKQHCGVCKPCARKRVALALNDVEMPKDYWAANFWEADWWKELSGKMAAHLYRGEEDYDFMKFAHENGIPVYPYSEVYIEKPPIL